FLSLSWYQDINEIRNRIVHGGVNIIPFYDNDELRFNAYNEDVDSIISHCSIYTVSPGLMVSASAYFTYFTSILHSYLSDFFSYVLAELKKTVTPTIEISESQTEMDREQVGSWPLSRLKEYNEYAQKNFNLPLGQERDDYASSRLGINRFQGEPGTIAFKKNMIESIVDKYSLSRHWINDSELAIPLDEKLIACAQIFFEELGKSEVDLWQTGPNDDRTHSILKFNFSVKSYEIQVT
ncbi:hypothetical protein, partial [Serratia bockelmannii]